MPECLFGCGQLNRPNQVTAPHWRDIKIPTPHLVAVPIGKPPHINDPVESPPQEIFHSAAHHENISTSAKKGPDEGPGAIEAGPSSILYTSCAAATGERADRAKSEPRGVIHHHSSHTSEETYAGRVSQPLKHSINLHERSIDLWEIIHNSSSDEEDNEKSNLKRAS